jgi:hypothetical protein
MTDESRHQRIDDAAAIVLAELHGRIESLYRYLGQEFEQMREQREMDYRRALWDTGLRVIKFREEGSRRRPSLAQSSAR